MEGFLLLRSAVDGTRRTVRRATEVLSEALLGTEEEAALNRDPIMEVVAQNPQEALRFIKLVMLFGASTGVLVSFPCTIYLSLYWGQCNCNRPLQWWVLVFSLLQLSQVPVRYLFFFHLHMTPDDRAQIIDTARILTGGRGWKCSKFVSILSYAWFILGVVWVFNAYDCNEAPGLWKLAVAAIVVSMLRLVTTFVCFWISFPPSGGIGQQLDQYRGAATAEQISRLPLYTYAEKKKQLTALFLLLQQQQQHQHQVTKNAAAAVPREEDDKERKEEQDHREDPQAFHRDHSPAITATRAAGVEISSPCHGSGARSAAAAAAPVAAPASVSVSSSANNDDHQTTRPIERKAEGDDQKEDVLRIFPLDATATAETSTQDKRGVRAAAEEAAAIAEAGKTALVGEGEIRERAAGSTEEGKEDVRAAGACGEAAEAASSLKNFLEEKSETLPFLRFLAEEQLRRRRSEGQGEGLQRKPEEDAEASAGHASLKRRRGNTQYSGFGSSRALPGCVSSSSSFLAATAATTAESKTSCFRRNSMAADGGQQLQQQGKEKQNVHMRWSRSTFGGCLSSVEDKNLQEKEREIHQLPPASWYDPRPAAASALRADKRSEEEGEKEKEEERMEDKKDKEEKKKEGRSANADVAASEDLSQQRPLPSAATPCPGASRRCAAVKLFGSCDLEAETKEESRQGGEEEIEETVGEEDDELVKMPLFDAGAAGGDAAAEKERKANEKQEGGGEGGRGKNKNDDVETPQLTTAAHSNSADVSEGRHERGVVALPTGDEDDGQGGGLFSVAGIAPAGAGASASAELSSVQENCCICLSEFQDAEIVRELRCTHFFHQPCIDRWLMKNKQCPLCLRNIDANEDTDRSTLQIPSSRIL